MIRSKEKRLGVLDAILVVAAFTVAATAIVIDVRFGNEAVRKIASDSMHDHFDFETFWYSARAFVDGSSIYYTGHPAVSANPPFFTVLISPLGLLDGFTAYKVYALTMLFMSVGYLAWTAEELSLRAGWAVGGVVALILSTPFFNTLSLGQIYPLLTLGLVAAWIADRRGAPLGAGAALGAVMVMKPSLLPLILWPLARRRWGMLGAAIASGAAVLLVGLVAAGPGATIDWLRFVTNRGIDEVWTNASLPGQADRLFRENGFAEPIAVLPWMVPVTLVLGVGIIVLTALRTRRDPEMGLWALVAASLLASPVAWENYMLLLGPGILLLVARGWWALALLLLALQALPSEWRLLWQDANVTVEALALTLYCLVLIAHWLVFLNAREEVVEAGEATLERPKKK